MRLGEIVQLRVADVRREAGVDFFDLSEEGGRKLKTEAGARQIPIHPALVDGGDPRIGVGSSRRRCRRPAAPVSRRTSGINGRRTRCQSGSAGFGTGSVSRRRRKRSTRRGTRSPTPCALRRMDATRSATGSILGHESGGVGARLYTRPLPLSRKYELVASVDYRAFMCPEAARTRALSLRQGVTAPQPNLTGRRLSEGDSALTSRERLQGRGVRPDQTRGLEQLQRPLPTVPSSQACG